MATTTVFLVLLALCACAHAVVNTVCTTDAECDDGECCQIMSEFMVASKKRQAAVTSTGTCQKYRVEFEGCSTYEQMNGYCGCGPGLYCHSYQVPINATDNGAVVRRRPPPPDEGYQWVNRCEVDQGDTTN